MQTIIIKNLQSRDIGDLIFDIPITYDVIKDANDTEIIPHKEDDLLLIVGNICGEQWLPNLHYLLKTYKCKKACYAFNHNFTDLNTINKYPDTMHLFDVIGSSTWDEDSQQRFLYSPDPIYKNIQSIAGPLYPNREGTIYYSINGDISPICPVDVEPKAYFEQIITRINKCEKIITDNYYGALIGFALGIKVVVIPKNTAVLGYSHMPEYAESLEEARQKVGSDTNETKNYLNFVEYHDKIILNSINNLINNNLRVAYSINSANLGDNLTWIGQVFKHADKPYISKCYLKTKWKELYREQLEGTKISLKRPTQASWDRFINLGVGQVDNWRSKNVEQIGALNLGMTYTPNRYSLAHLALKRPRSDKYITYATHGSWAWKSLQPRSRWVDIKKMVKEQTGMDMVNVSFEGDEVSKDIIKGAITYIYHSELFIGGPSGLTWLAWFLDKTPLLISGVTMSGTEMLLDEAHEIRATSGCRNCYHFVEPFPSQNECATGKNYSCWQSITNEMIVEKIVNLVTKDNKP